MLKINGIYFPGISYRFYNEIQELKKTLNEPEIDGLKAHTLHGLLTTSLSTLWLGNSYTFIADKGSSMFTCILVHGWKPFAFHVGRQYHIVEEYSEDE